MLKLGGLALSSGAHHRRKRVGRGERSGHGKTCCRGTKGQKARASPPRPGFEGGQMPLVRRVPKRGFVNIFGRKFVTVNLDTLDRKFAEGNHVTAEMMRQAGIIRKGPAGRVKVLARGSLTKALTVEANSFSAGAREKIEKAGGKVIVC